MTETTNGSSYIEKILFDLPAFIEKYPEIEAIIAVLLPYVPALKKLAEEEVQAVIDDMLSNRWRKVDEKLVKLMTKDERLALLDETYKEAFASAEAQYRHKQLLYDVAVKVALACMLAFL